MAEDMRSAADFGSRDVLHDFCVNCFCGFDVPGFEARFQAEREDGTSEHAGAEHNPYGSAIWSSLDSE